MRATIDRRSSLSRGARDSVPLGIALIAVGIAFGYAAHEAGLDWWSAGLMSLVIHAGPSQFLAVALIGAGAAIPMIVATVFVANLRYALFAATLAPHLHDAPRRRLFALAHGLADGSYAVTLTHRAAEPDAPRLDRYFAGSIIVAFGIWTPATIVGALLGGAVPDALGFGLGFATPAIFLGFLVASITDTGGVLVMLVAGIGTVAANETLPAGTGPLVAIALASLLGGTWTWRRRAS